MELSVALTDILVRVCGCELGLLIRNLYRYCSTSNQLKIDDYLDNLSLDLSISKNDILNYIKTLNTLKVIELNNDTITMQPDFLQFVTSEKVDDKTIENIKQIINKNKKENVKEVKKQIIIKKLKDNIVCSDIDILHSLRKWVDSVCAKPDMCMSLPMVQKFMKGLNDYSTNKEVQLALIDIATMKQYVNVEWAINIYNKGNTWKTNNQSVKDTMDASITF